MISLRLFTKAKNFRFKYLSLEEFLSLKFIDANELNNLMRSAHFDLITNDRKLVFISQIIEFFNKSHNLNFSNSKVVEPKYIELSKYPRHLIVGSGIMAILNF